MPVEHPGRPGTSSCAGTKKAGRGPDQPGFGTDAGDAPAAATAGRRTQTRVDLHGPGRCNSLCGCDPLDGMSRVLPCLAPGLWRAPATNTPDVLCCGAYSA